MSGPKSGSYQIIETAADIAARELRQARQEEAAAQAAWDAVAARIATARAMHPSRIVAMPSAPRAAKNAAAAVRSRAIQLTEIARRAREDLEGQLQQAASAALHQHLQSAGLLTVTLAAAPPPRAANKAASDVPKPPPPVDAGIAARVQRRLDELPSDADPAVITRAVDLAAQVRRATSQWRADGLLDALSATVEQARAVAARHRADAATRDAAAGQLAALRTSLNEITGDRVAKLRDHITALSETRPLAVPAGLREQVTAVLTAHQTAQHQLRVTKALREGLLELGYLLGPEFDTQLQATGVAFARTASTPYGVKFRLEPDATRFTAQVVTPDDRVRSRDEDAAAEQTFCSDLAELLDHARRHGINTRLDIRTPAGAVPVQRVPASSMPAAARTAGRQQLRQERL